MKKTVKSLIIAASVAAIAGIGAVSFAAWNVNTDSNVDTNAGGLGNVTATVGFVLTGSDTATPDLTLTDKLMPYNQAAADVDTGETQMWSVALADINVTAKDWTATLTQTGMTLESGSSFYYTVNTTETEALPTTDLSAWTQLNGTNAVEITNTEAQTLKGYYLHIILDSSNLKDMDKTGAVFTLTLAEKADA